MESSSGGSPMTDGLPPEQDTRLFAPSTEWSKATSIAVFIIPNGIVLGLVVLAVLTAIGTVSTRDAFTLVLLVIGLVLMFFGVTFMRKRRRMADISMESHPQELVPQVGYFRDLAILLMVGGLVAWAVAIDRLM
jgi:DMSO reductase anchor subunit